MGAFSALLAYCAGNSPVTGEFPLQRPVTRSFDVFFDLRQNTRLINTTHYKQFWMWSDKSNIQSITVRSHEGLKSVEPRLIVQQLVQAKAQKIMFHITGALREKYTSDRRIPQPKGQ